MKVLKWLFFGLLGLVVILLMVAIFLPSSRHMEGRLQINAPARVIFAQVNNLKNWEKWSPFQQEDTAMVSEYSGPESGVGAKTSWISKVNGNGSMVITYTMPDDTLKTELIFMGDSSSKAYSDWYFTTTLEGTEVTWTTDIQGLGYPVGRLFGLIMPSMMNKAFMQGLTNLKSLCESMAPDAKTGEVERLIVDPRTVIVLEDSAMAVDMGPKIGEMLGKLMGLVKQKGIKMAGAPFGIYPEWNPNGLNHFKVAIPFTGSVKLSGEASIESFPEQEMVVVSHFGAPETTGDAYSKIGAYAAAKEIKLGMPAWEDWITDPSVEKDPLKLETKIYFPIVK